MNNAEGDPATFEIIKNGLFNIAEEMRVVLAKTAYSPLLKSAGDYSCGIFDAGGEMVAQGPDLPIHLGSMPDAVRAVVAAFATDVQEGDVFVHNDPYCGGSHLPDVNVVRPAFHAGRLWVIPACALTGRMSAPRRRAATALSPRFSARGCAFLPCASSAAARSMPISRN